MAKNKASTPAVVNFQHNDKRTNIPTSALSGQANGLLPHAILPFLEVADIGRLAGAKVCC